MMGWDVVTAGFTVTLFTVRRVSITQTTLIIAALLGRTATAWLLSTLQIFLDTLTHSCVTGSLVNRFGFPPFYVTNFLTYA